MTRLNRSSGYRKLALGSALFVGWLDLCAGYQFLLAVIASPGSSGYADEGTSLATVILVPAHNETHVIGACLESLRSQVPALEADRIVVIADNCTDDTADTARAAGVAVWERTDEQRRGKGPALAWAIERLEREFPVTQVVGVVDADCVALPNLSAGWSAAIRRGAAAAQSDYRISNPAESASAARRWAGFALRHKIRGTAKERLGLSCGLYGTGMAFSIETLRNNPWTSFSVTEDAEYHARIVERGGRVAFVANTAVESPAPVSEAAAQAQQMRWESGNVELAIRTVPGLLLASVTKRDPRRLHLALEQLVPPQSLLAAGLALISVGGAMSGQQRLARAGTAGLVAQVGYVTLGLRVAKAPVSVWTSLATAPALIVRKLSQFALISAGRRPRDWVKTQR